MSCESIHRLGPARRPRSTAAAFSLLEIMVVLVIIGLLAGLVTINVRGRMIMARQNAAKLELATIADAVESFYMVYGRYPSNEEGLAILNRKTDKLPEPLLERATTDPWGRPYVYLNPARDRPYEVICLGADGRQGGEGGDADLSNATLKDEPTHAP
jgi:general secretion pathway protein G